jgi:hypothetical protein
VGVARSCRPGFPQRQGWRCSAQDGATTTGMAVGLTVTEETRSTGPTSRRRPVQARGRRSYPSRGFRHPISRGAVHRPYGSGWHSVTVLTLALLHSPVQWQGWPRKEGWRNIVGV